MNSDARSEDQTSKFRPLAAAHIACRCIHHPYLSQKAESLEVIEESKWFTHRFSKTLAAHVATHQEGERVGVQVEV